VAASGALSAANYQQAVQRVNTWFKDQCGG
jgi:hypothetical protein